MAQDDTQSEGSQPGAAHERVEQRRQGRTRRGILIGTGAVLGTGVGAWGIRRFGLVDGEGPGPGAPSPAPEAGCLVEREFPATFPSDLEVLGDVPLEGESLGAPFTQASLQDVAVVVGTDERERLLVTQHGATAQIQLIPLDGESKNIVHDVEVGVNPGIAVDDGVCWFVTREDGRVLSVGPDPEYLQDHGSVSEGTTSLYSPVIGRGGAVFGGSYPSGAVWRLDPGTSRVTLGPRIGDNDYVRSLALVDGRLFAGTGGNAPALYEIDQESLAPVAVHAVPGVRTGGSVSRLISMPGGSMIVFRDEEDGGADGVFFDSGSGTFGTELSPGASSRSLAVDPESDGMVYVASDRVQHLDPRTFSVSDEGPSAVANPAAVVTRASGAVVGVSSTADGSAALELAPLAGSFAPQVVDLVPSAHDITAVIPLASTSQLAIGGYQANGVVVVDDAGRPIASTAQGSGVQQVEGGIETGEGSVLVGSYGEGRLHEVTVVEGEETAQSQEISDLGEEFRQARPVAWARFDDAIAVGTVPEQGRVGGLIHLLHRDGEQIDPAGILEDPADGRSIVGIVLLNDDEAVVTTSVLGGYGAESTAETATIMRLSLASGKVLWSADVEVLDAYTPRVQNGVVFCGTTDGILALDLDSGELLVHAVIGEPAERAGYTSARIEPWRMQGRFLHVARGQLSVVDLVEGTVAVGSDGVGSPLSVISQEVFAASGPELVKFTLPADMDLPACGE